MSSFVISQEQKKYLKVLCPAVPTFDTVALFTDMNIELPCQCQTNVETPIFWYYKKSANSFKTRVLTSEKDDSKSRHVESKITTKVNSVIIHKARVEDSGLYICGSSDGEFFWGYDVDVQDAKDAYVAFQEHQQLPQPNLVTEHLTAFTAFWDWEQCDRCDVRGEQRRIGLCYVKSTLLDPRYRITENDIASCGSDAVPPNLQDELSDRKPEIYFRSCETTCHKRKEGLLGTIKYWVHKLSKIKDYIPWLPKAPTEKHVHTLGSSLTLACPGARPEDAVAWDKGNRRLYKADYLIGQKKAERIYIDYGNNLNFRSVTFSDKATYYCWLKEYRKAGVKLDVQADPTEKRKFSDSDSMLALRYIGISFDIFTLIFIAVHCYRCACYNFRCSPSIGESV